MTQPATISADYTLRPSELAATLALLVEARQPAMVWGAPGTAKSMIAQQVAADGGREYVDVRALLLDPVDLRGIPWRDAADRAGTSALHGAVPPFCGLGNAVQQDRRCLQVPVGSGDIDVAEMGGERQHVTAWVGAGFHVFQGADGEAVPKGVGCGPACRPGFANPCLFRELAEGRPRLPAVWRPAGGKYEEVPVGGIFLAPDREIAVQRFPGCEVHHHHP